MGRKSLQVKGYSPESIKALFNSDDRYKIGMRLYAVYQVSLGQPSRKLEDFYNTSFNTDTWTGPILIEWIKSQFDIVFKKAQIYNILRKNGFSYQKARGFYPEADLEKQEVFKDTLKKTSSE
jgi:transposase